jgi:hypothetical protein
MMDQAGTPMPQAWVQAKPWAGMPLCGTGKACPYFTTTVTSKVFSGATPASQERL